MSWSGDPHPPNPYTGVLHDRQVRYGQEGGMGTPSYTLEGYAHIVPVTHMLGVPHTPYLYEMQHMGRKDINRYPRVVLDGNLGSEHLRPC